LHQHSSTGVSIELSGFGYDFMASSPDIVSQVLLMPVHVKRRSAFVVLHGFMPHTDPELSNPDRLQRSLYSAGTISLHHSGDRRGSGVLTHKPPEWQELRTNEL
jgi:hypothetical protein